MVAVALVGLMFGIPLELKSRSQRFQRVANEHLDRTRPIYSLVGMPIGWKPPPLPRISRESDLYHKQMATKYEFAARYPWLPVAPEPPKPN
jgi:hypothetical protein